jgi:hypothetical protein
MDSLDILNLTRWRHHHHRARKLKLVYTWNGITVIIKGDLHMGIQFSQPGQTVSVVATPLTAAGQPSLATLSLLSFTSSDPTLFTVALDPTTPNGAILTAVGPGVSGSATLTAEATATEPDGVTTEQISGTDTETYVGGVTPPPPVAASLGFTYGPINPPPSASAGPKRK